MLTWPTGLIHDGRGVCGYTMPRIASRDFVPLVQLMTSSRRGAVGSLSWQHLVTLGLRLCHVVRTLHGLGYAVGDLNDRNVLVSRKLTPLLMDTDSFQVPKRLGHHPCVVGDALYWPPELLDVDLATFRGSRVPGDRYALGVLLFQLFMDGFRPYQATGSRVLGLETLAEKTRAGHYPWSRPEPGILEPPAAAPDYRRLPKPLRHAFERCFVAGHRNPGRRPTADDWYDVLASVRQAGDVVALASPRPRVQAPVARVAVARMAPHRPAQGKRGDSRGPPLAALPTPAAAAAVAPRARVAAAAPKVAVRVKATKTKSAKARRSETRPRRPVHHASRQAAPRVRWAAWALVAAATGLLAIAAL